MVCYRKNSRKHRKSSRKDSRKNRKSSRKMNMRRMNYFGGQYDPMALSLAQGRQYQELHQNQHGGSSTQMAHGAPVGYDGMLPADLRASARVEPTFSAMQQIQGMSDMPQATTTTQQTGGRRRKSKTRKSKSKKSKKSRKGSKKSRKGSRKSRKGSRKSRKMRGGMAPYNSPSMLLSPAMAAKAGTADFSNPLLKY